MSEPQQYFIVNIDPRFDAGSRQLIGNDIVSFIEARTNQGLDRFNRPFKKYAESYINSLDFKLAGKTPQQVNLRLTGDMHASLRVLSHGPGFIKIGFPGMSDENDKAKWNAEKGRDLLGIMPKDLAYILRQYEGPQSEYLNLVTSVANEVLRVRTETDEL